MRLRRLAIMEEAARDLRYAQDFYESKLAGLGYYCFDSLVADIEALGFFAGIHPRQFGFYRCLAKRFPFAIYYDIDCDDERVVIAAVLDMRRDPQRNITRLNDSDG